MGISLSIKTESIMSGPPICPICHGGYLYHGFRINILECDNCNEIFDINNISIEVN